MKRLHRLVGLLVLVFVTGACAPVALKQVPVQCLLAAVITTGMSGCEPAPLMSEAADAAGKQFSPVPGHSSIYVVRPSIVGGTELWTIAIDGKPVAPLAVYTYVLLDVEPGIHQIQVATSETLRSIVVDANRDENHYMEAVPTMGTTRSRAELCTVTQEQGMLLIRHARRVEFLPAAQEPAEMAASGPGAGTGSAHPIPQQR